MNDNRPDSSTPGIPGVDDPAGFAHALMATIAMFGHCVGRLNPDEAPALIDYVDRMMTDGAQRKGLSANDIDKLVGAIEMARAAARGEGPPP